MTFQIVRCMPVYHPVYDGICGVEYKVLPNLYETYAFPRKLAGKLEEEYFDDGFYVIKTGDRVDRAHHPEGTKPTVQSPAAWAAETDDIPF